MTWDTRGWSPERRESFAVAKGLHAGMCVVADFVNGPVRAAVRTEDLNRPVLHAIWGQFMRVATWSFTLKRLDEPADFQAVAAAARGMLESTIDIVLLLEDNADVVERFEIWELSAKLKHGEALVRHYGQAGREEQGPVFRFVEENRDRINAARLKFDWVETRPGKAPRPRHPARWTDRDLGTDAKVAQERQPEVTGFRFSDYYETKYRELCWHVHGAGFVARAIGQDDFPALAGLTLPGCMDLAVCAAMLTSEALGKLTRELMTELIGAEARRNRAISEVMARYRTP